MALTALSALGFIAMVLGLVGLIATRSLLSPAPVVIAVQAAALALMVWARLTFGRRSFHATAAPTEGDLVTSGPYRWVRHPIYTAVALFAVAGALARPTVASAGLAAAVVAGAVVRMLAEERVLRRRFPEYAAYARRTRRMIPFLF